MTKDSRLSAAQWVDCEAYHDSFLKFLDRSGGHPGKEPFGYDIYRVHVPKAPVMDNFPQTMRQWEAHTAKATQDSTGTEVSMSSEAFSVMANVPNVIARTVGDLMALANLSARQVAPQPAPRFPRFPRYGIAKGALPMMGRNNRTHGGLIGRVGGRDQCEGMESC
ncbi:hypothetical protein MVEN_00316800 [Mycena venus]|uniref:Uncharacterized protein n=1 Tax=Mycena venus TaxID=2733690 RepID=A0A8H6YNR0_9AGAR|nr:hypothetical protein MVEN_00316800 [Mycena venus]